MRYFGLSLPARKLRLSDRGKTADFAQVKPEPIADGKTNEKKPPTGGF